MKLNNLVQKAADKNRFIKLQNYIDFSLLFLEYIDKNKQADIISQNENKYKFFQFNKEAHFKVTRPYNSDLLFIPNLAEEDFKSFKTIITHIKEDKDEAIIEDRSIINNAIYSIQQSIGFALDAGTAMGVEPNTARKINGDLFERLIQIILQDIGLNCKSGVISIPVKVDGEALFKMNYQHDLIIEDDQQNLKIIGSVKTTSKDRIDKIFIDKFLYSKLTETAIPHIAIFLHDVQRKKTKRENEFGINTTFLSGHFKGYTIKLNPLDGVYYFDLRPNMINDKLLSKHIQPFDFLICEDIWKLLND